MKICPKSYNDDTGRKSIEQVNEHSRKDINSNIFKNLIKATHKTVTLDNFTVLGSFTAIRNLREKWESLFIKHSRVNLNKHDMLIPEVYSEPV